MNCMQIYLVHKIYFAILPVLSISLLCTKSVLGTISRTLCYDQSVLLNASVPSVYHVTGKTLAP